jgi:hypothetical protein
MDPINIPPINVSIYTSTMDPMFFMISMIMEIFQPEGFGKTLQKS